MPPYVHYFGSSHGGFLMTGETMHSQESAAEACCSFCVAKMRLHGDKSFGFLLSLVNPFFVTQSMSEGSNFDWVS